MQSEKDIACLIHETSTTFSELEEAMVNMDLRIESMGATFQ